MDNSLLKKLCLECGISGFEEDVASLIYCEIKDYADEIKKDALGNLIVFKKGKDRARNKLMISAHMDEVGFIVTDIADSGLLSFEPVGGIDRRVVLGDSVTIGKAKVNGVIGIKPVHLCNEEEAARIPKFSEMFIDIGAESKEQAEALVSPGDFVCFDSPYINNENSIMAKALDDRAGCAIMIEMIKSELPYDMYFTFVVQEEVGLRGSATAAYDVSPEYAVVIESTTAADIPTVNGKSRVCSVGGGAVVSFMDKATIYDRHLVNAVFEAAERLDLKVQYKKAVSGGNDSAAIQRSKSGVRTVSLSLPCRYLHSPVGLISCEDYDCVKGIAQELAKMICGGMI